MEFGLLGGEEDDKYSGIGSVETADTFVETV